MHSQTHASSKPDIPAVSVILPTYNRRAHLGASVRSVLEQSFRDIELIVVDDGSTDCSDAFVRGLPDPRIRLLRLPVNEGQAAARNAGLRAARAPLVAFQDSDDEWLPEKLQVQVAALERHPDAAMVYGDLLRVPADGAPFVIESPELARNRIFDKRRTVYATFGLGIQSCLIRRDILIALSGFDVRLRQYEDLELFLRIARRYRTIRLPRVLACYRETAGVSGSTRHTRAARLTLLRRYGWRMLLQRPGALMREASSLAFGAPRALL